MIFNGDAQVYTTCRICHQTMQVIDLLDFAHPCCNPDRQIVEEKVVDELAVAAVTYVRWGWPIFPLRGFGTKCDGGERCQPVCQCPKKPVTRHGFKDATTDVVQVQNWWKRHPTHNIGIATGHLFDVIDIDPKSGGDQSFTKLLEQQRIPQCHAIAKTSSGGRHLYIAALGKRNSANMKPGIDYRGLGGYVAAPPSTRGPGHLYTWLVNPSPKIKVGST